MEKGGRTLEEKKIPLYQEYLPFDDTGCNSCSVYTSMYQMMPVVTYYWHMATDRHAALSKSLLMKLTL